MDTVCIGYSARHRVIIHDDRGICMVLGTYTVFPIYTISMEISSVCRIRNIVSWSLEFSLLKISALKQVLSVPVLLVSSSVCP